MEVSSTLSFPLVFSRISVIFGCLSVTPVEFVVTGDSTYVFGVINMLRTRKKYYADYEDHLHLI